MRVSLSRITTCEDQKKKNEYMCHHISLGMSFIFFGKPVVVTIHSTYLTSLVNVLLVGEEGGKGGGGL